MKRIRFSLRGLILLVTAVGLFLGARDWRKREVLKLCDQLQKDANADRYMFDVPNSWHDYIWQRKPTVGCIFWHAGEERMTLVVGRSASDIVSATNDRALIERLKDLGVVKYGNSFKHPNE